mgnify:CR=1 FL=1
MPKKMKLAIVAGETSGDTIGADFLREMHLRSLKFEALGIGGSRMQSQGFKSLYDMEKLSIRGYVEVLQSLPELLLIRITVMEKTQMDHAVSKTIYIIELAAAKPPTTLRYASFSLLSGPFAPSPDQSF